MFEFDALYNAYDLFETPSSKAPPIYRGVL
jgi:hypothetical protein